MPAKGKVRTVPSGLAGVCLIAVVAAGCVHYRPAPLSPQASLERFEARTLDAPAVTRFVHDRAGVGHWPPPAFDLSSLTLVGLFYSPDLDVARSRWEAARAATVTAGQHPNPSLSLPEGYNATSVGIRPWIPEAVLGLPIETGGKRGARIAAADSLAEAARLDVISTAWQVRSRVRSAFLDLWVARRNATLLEEERTLRDQTVRLLTAQLEIGEISADELTQARIAADRAGLAALDASRQEEQARIALAAALGVPPAALRDIAYSFGELERLESEPPPDELRRRALTGRSDILAALAAYEASQAALRLEIARQYPDIDIGAGYQLDQTDSKWTLSLSLPLPVRNRNRGPIAEAEARRAEAAARFVALQSTVVSDLAGAVAAYHTAAEQAAAADAMAAHLRARAAAAREAFRVGEVSKLDLVGARAELISGELARLQAMAAAQRAAGVLENAIQGPLELQAWVLERPERRSGEGEPNDE